MKTNIIGIITKANFNRGFIRYVKNKFPADFTLLIEQPFQYNFPDNPLLDLSNGDLLFTLLYELIPLKEFYDSRNIPDTVFYDSLDDISFHINRYFDTHGEYSVNKSDLQWLSFIYKCEIFDLGSLRFQKIHFTYAEFERESYDYMPLSDEVKKRFVEGESIIKVHIQKDANLKSEKIDTSFRLAHDFFTSYFPEHNFKVFTCRSWMLYPPMQDILPPDSNITAFANRFEIIATNQNTKQALDRIYETSDMAEIEKMEKPSSLAKVAYKNLDKLGVAAGVIPRIDK